MNGRPPSPDRARDAELIDELLSAALDGELDAAAGDLGLTPAAARALVEENADRGSALGAAQDRLAEAPPALDEVTRRRLVSGAAAAVAGPGAAAGAAAVRRRRWLVAAAGAAAALTLFGAVAALVGMSLHGDDAGDAASGGRSSESADTSAALAPTADLGEVSDPAVLRALLDESAAATRQATGSGDRSNASDPLAEGAEAYTTTEISDLGSDGSADDEDKGNGADLTAEPGSTAAPAATSAGSGGDQPDAVDCPTFLAADFDEVGAPVLLATATYEGEPAGVLVFGGDARLAVVYDAVDCSILATLSLTTP